MGWKEKVFNSDNLKSLSAAQGSAWKNKEDMDTAESVPQLLELQLAVTEGGLWDNVRKKGSSSLSNGGGKEWHSEHFHTENDVLKLY